MSLYLDTLKKKKKKTCFQLKKKRRKKRKKERCHFILTSHDCDFVFCFATLFFSGRRWKGRASGRRICLSGLFFFFFFLFSRLAQAHTYSQSLVTRCWACSFPCMDHPVTIVCKQCGEGRRDEADSEEKRYMLIYLISERALFII